MTEAKIMVTFRTIDGGLKGLWALVYGLWAFTAWARVIFNARPKMSTYRIGADLFSEREKGRRGRGEKDHQKS